MPPITAAYSLPNWCHSCMAMVKATHTGPSAPWPSSAESSAAPRGQPAGLPAMPADACRRRYCQGGAWAAGKGRPNTWQPDPASWQGEACSPEAPDLCPQVHAPPSCWHTAAPYSCTIHTAAHRPTLGWWVGPLCLPRPRPLQQSCPITPNPGVTTHACTQQAFQAQPRGPAPAGPWVTLHPGKDRRGTPPAPALGHNCCVMQHSAHSAAPRTLLSHPTQHAPWRKQGGGPPVDSPLTHPRQVPPPGPLHRQRVTTPPTAPPAVPLPPLLHLQPPPLLLLPHSQGCGPPPVPPAEGCHTQ